MSTAPLLAVSAPVATIERLYTDGACSGNPGPGGWGTVIYFDDGSVHELGGCDRNTTNNRMEMQAAIAALDFLIQTNQRTPVALYTDSEYVKKGITQWISGWKRKGWKTAAGKAVLNKDLWQALDQLNTQASQQLQQPVQWCYVRGHSGDEGNERCDTIARAYSHGQPISLRQEFPHLGPTAAKIRKTTDSSLNLAVNPAVSTAQADPTVESSYNTDVSAPNANSFSMSDMSSPQPNVDHSDSLPRESRVLQLRNAVETLHLADEVAKQGYLITSAELADLMDVNASAVTSRGEYWAWRNWTVSRVRREGNQILWQLERID